MAGVIDSDRDAVQHDGLPMTLFSRVDDGLWQVKHSSRRSGKGVRLSVEFFGNDVDAAFIDALVTKVAGQLFHAEEAWFGNDAARYGGPQLVVRAVGW